MLGKDKVMQNQYYDAEFIFPEETTVTLTRSEIDALNAYAEKIRRETVKAIFGEVKELLEARYRIEDKWASMCENAEDRGDFLYGRGLCEKLIIDLQKIERKWEDETD